MTVSPDAMMAFENAIEQVAKHYHLNRADVYFMVSVKAFSMVHDIVEEASKE